MNNYLINNNKRKKEKKSKNKLIMTQKTQFNKTKKSKDTSHN